MTTYAQKLCFGRQYDETDDECLHCNKRPECRHQTFLNRASQTGQPRPVVVTSRTGTSSSPAPLRTVNVDFGDVTKPKGGELAGEMVSSAFSALGHTFGDYFDVGGRRFRFGEGNTCPGCQNPVDASAKFCGQCGQKLME